MPPCSGTLPFGWPHPLAPGAEGIINQNFGQIQSWVAAQITAIRHAAGIARWGMIEPYQPCHFFCNYGFVVSFLMAPGFRFRIAEIRNC